MKRLITAVSFAVLAVPALAAERGAPYDQSLVDRALPQIEFNDNASFGATAPSPERMPYDQNLVDRALPQIGDKAPARARAERGLPYDQVQIDRAVPAL